MENLINNFSSLSFLEIVGVACFISLFVMTMCAIAVVCYRAVKPYIITFAKFIGLIFYSCFIRKKKSDDRRLQNRFKNELEEEEISEFVNEFKGDALICFGVFTLMGIGYYFLPAINSIIHFWN